MPGFNIGGGTSANQKSHVAETRRKHRWAVTALGTILAPGDLIYLQKANRPQFKYDAAEMHHNQEVAWFAGKQSWETMTWTFYDTLDPNLSAKLRLWVGSVTTSFNTPAAQTTVAPPNVYKVNSTIVLYDGAGAITETWTLYGVWPESTNWNDLDYTNSDIQTIEVTVRYDKAVGS